MDTLCDDIIFHISTFLTTKNTLRLCGVSKKCDKSWGNNAIWKNIFKKDIYYDDIDFKKVFKLLYLDDKYRGDGPYCDIQLCFSDWDLKSCCICNRNICWWHHMDNPCCDICGEK